MRFLVVVLCVTTVWGYQHFQDEIPNGKSVPHPCKDNHMWKGVGHLNQLGGGVNNQFGSDFENAGKKWTKSLCMMDSDGDGKTNGEELGDPNCVWTKGGTPAVTIDISHPGICTPYSDPVCKGANLWVNCDAEEFKCDALNEVGMKNTTIRFPETAVPTTSKSSYCMVTDLPTDGDYHLLANKPYINNDDVVHQILLYGCDETSSNAILTFPVNTPKVCNTAIRQQCNVLIGKWTDGLSGECLHRDFGFRIGRNGFRKALMRIQWHNPVKSSFGGSFGMTLFYTANRRMHDANIITVGQEYMAIPPGEASYQVDGRCSGDCSSRKLSSPVYITRAYNHMHTLGRKQRLEHYRNGLKLRDIAYDDTYSYSSPVIHDFQDPIEFRPGDELRTTCTYTSVGKTMTTFQGTKKSEEACFSFLTFYPADNMKFPHCVQWKGIDMCKLNDQKQDFPVINGCNVHAFQNITHPDFKSVYDDVFSLCKPFGGCLTECQKYTDEVLDKHSCLQGDIGAMFRHSTKSVSGIDYLKFWGAVESCKKAKPCQCKKSPTSPSEKQCPKPVPVSTSTGGADVGVASMFVLILSLFTCLMI
ncbi:tyramine beta-hydroxylase-like isoform X2 [Pecten maximus]|nr:tyramine beta-hydroxylase-like isoform X2 [Pecten maximus]XP_033732462.1 tyramine beta-hydroxylase-like isoform X2 [Pecten maximus]